MSKYNNYKESEVVLTKLTTENQILWFPYFCFWFFLKKLKTINKKTITNYFKIFIMTFWGAYDYMSHLG